MPAQISVITGDLVNSRQLDTTHYITELHALLTQLQQAKLIQTFEVFRGDAFQAVAEPQSGLLLAVYIRIALKAMDTRHWDARIAVGLGAGEAKNAGYGSAFVNSGQALDGLTKNCRLALKNDNDQTNAIVSDLLPMLDHVVSRLSQTEARIVRARILATTNQEVAEKLQKAASTVSATLKRAAYEEIMRFIHAINRIT
ncbi:MULTISPECIES: SatD family protein [Serratia]|jgi:DNA-binding CsgD family transcriptional regulator|uniref:SatD family protein n=1 Tax=Serratia TaxID=613 RepID=UPI001AEB5374|nr:MULTISPECIES: SatD family protein [Serratia]